MCVSYILFFLHFIQFFFVCRRYFRFFEKLSSAHCFIIIIIIGFFVCGHCFHWCVDIFIFVFFLLLSIHCYVSIGFVFDYQEVYASRERKKIFDYNWKGIERNRTNFSVFFCCCMRPSTERTRKRKKKLQEKRIFLFQISLSLHFDIVRVQATPVN